MRDIWVVSDTHFNHANIIKYCNRPFKTTKEMDETIIERWNNVVKPNDKVYHLGDVYMGGSNGYIGSIFQRLNGYKRLILGNHDTGKDQILQRYFERISSDRYFKEFGLHLTHIPLHHESIKGDVNVHGHIHDKQSPKGPYRCVCVEQINYTPIHIEELRVK